MKKKLPRNRHQLPGEAGDWAGAGLFCNSILSLHVRDVPGAQKTKIRMLDQGRVRGIFGYSDDNWALAPSLASLQDMITTMERYAKDHNMTTDPNPRKCKTKTMVFVIRKTAIGQHHSTKR